MIVAGVEGYTSIFRLPKCRNICLSPNIAIFYSCLQGALIYGRFMWAVNVNMNSKCIVGGIDIIETKIIQDLRLLLLLLLLLL